MALLEVEDLAVRYASRLSRAPTKAVLSGVTFEVNAGETVGLVGESGSGKSTIGKAILGLAPVTSGSIRFGGREISNLASNERRALSQEIQVVFQDPYSSFNPNLPIGESVGETLLYRRDIGKVEIRQKVAEMLTRVGLGPEAASRYPAQFSGGQRQRIAIARALLPDPKLVICDEAVSALDLSVQAQILNLLLDLQQETGTAFLFITHDLSVVRHVSARIVVLNMGKIVESGTNKEVLDTPREVYTRRLIAAAPVADPDLQRERRIARIRLR
ncbi:ATP-binding cassette domain-containing protein [Rhizobium sp. ICMP 5592]|uniref:ATP-binding cassette domain-containing protein n=1 Tax=Rhizobium sp. ICMP 5592 TaxID=2292445 RepID=UPI001296D79A|nr:ATP-binding cassette domain-containing protein [Rhizobium sp. ICMP 5592]MQB46018.1 ABC transporter ATP-binding protein [Rhizobium sp. ICMP 5592]